LLVLHEYLLSYGNAGEFGRFRPSRPIVLRRGDRAVVRSHRGVELGTVLCEARSGHAYFLPNTSIGQLLRAAGVEDEASAQRMIEKARRLFDDSRRLAETLGLPLEIIDAEHTVDDGKAIADHLTWADCDQRPFVSTLTREYDIPVALHSLVAEKTEDDHEDGHGCGRPDCGQTKDGGCSSCSTGGGCSTCGSAKPDDVRAHFSELREKMMTANRMPLL